MTLALLPRYIDWGPFFIGWEMPGRFPEVLTDPIFGVEATRLYNDAQKLLAQIVERKMVYGKRCHWHLARH